MLSVYSEGYRAYGEKFRANASLPGPWWVLEFHYGQPDGREQVSFGPVCAETGEDAMKTSGAAVRVISGPFTNFNEAMAEAHRAVSDI